MPRSFINAAKLNEAGPVKTLISTARKAGLLTDEQLAKLPDRLTLNAALRHLKELGAFTPPAGMAAGDSVMARVVPERFNVYGSLVDPRKNYLNELLTRYKDTLFFVSDSNLSGPYSSFFAAGSDNEVMPAHWMNSLEYPAMFCTRFKGTYLMLSYSFLSIY